MQTNQRCRLGLDILSNYAKLRTDTQAVNILAWTPVVTEILDGFCHFDEKMVGLLLQSWKLAITRIIRCIYPSFIHFAQVSWLKTWYQR